MNLQGMKFSRFLQALCLSATLLFTSFVYASHQVVSKIYQEQSLYPQLKPFNEGYLKVSEIHSIYFAEFGNPQGTPVVTLHGGPGSQCEEFWTSLFNPEFYHVIMFDQRASGRSVPFAEMFDNTPQASVGDMEKLRAHLKVDKWIVFGGSYGSLLSLLYGETHPENCLGFVLRGIFLGTRSEYEHLFYGMKKTYPEAWEVMVADFQEHEKNDLISAFYKRVMNPDPSIHLPAAQAFMVFDTLCVKLIPTADDIQEVYSNTISTLGIGRAFIHHAAHEFFLKENQILDNLYRIDHLPAIIVQGRYDIICPPSNAFTLFQKWIKSELWFISDAGHATSDVSQGLREAMDLILQE